MQKLIATLFALLLFASVHAQQKQDVLNYIQQYKDIAIEEMVRAKIPASITMAQGIIETGSGASPLARNANNHFGIKCKESWTGKKYFHDDDAPNECFRVYSSARNSYADHSDFLMSRPWYAPLWQLKTTDYKSWAHGLKSAGYATNPQYAYMLIKTIEDYKLAELDQQGIAMIEEKEQLLKMGTKTTEAPVLASAEPETVIITEVKTTESKPVESKPIETVSKKAEKGQRTEYTVNGIRALKAVGNEDPLKVALEYQIDYSFVMSYNDLNTGDRFKNGEYIFLQPKKSKGTEVTYTVSVGETMRDVAQKNGIKLRDLYLRNQMKMNDQAYAGEALALQEKRSVPPRTMSYAEYLKTLNNTTTPDGRASNTIRLDDREYRVQHSDTLYSIAGKFNTTIDKLKEANSLATNEVKAGQTIVIAQ